MANSYREEIEALKVEAENVLSMVPPTAEFIDSLIDRACAFSLAEGKRQQHEKARPLFSVDFDKNGEMDFRVRGDLAQLSYEEMREFREMVVVGIGTAESSWRREQENKLPAGSLTPRESGE